MWAKFVSTLAQNRSKALLSLEAHQLYMEASLTSKEDLEKEVSRHHELHAACRQEEEFWRQKSRSLWLKAEDWNTAFFHKQTEARKQHKTAQEIRSQDQVVTEFDKIKVEASRHFSVI